jgi:hypothetical protein
VGHDAQRCVDRRLAQAGTEGTMRKPLEGRTAQVVRSNFKLGLVLSGFPAFGLKSVWQALANRKLT